MQLIITSITREKRESETRHSIRYQFARGLPAAFAAIVLVLFITGPAMAQPNFAVAGYNLNGGLDPSFGGDGKVVTSFGNGLYGSVAAVAADSSGRVVVAGTVNGKFAVARYNTNGSPDATFGNAGQALTGLIGSLYALAIDNNGKIVVAGDAGASFTLVRFNTDGSLDCSFTNTWGCGIVKTSFPSASSSAHAIAIDAAGKIVAAGTAQDSYDGKFALARYNSDGSLDTSFSSNGKVTTNTSPPLSDHAYNWEEANDIAIDSAGRIVVAGTVGSQDGNLGGSVFAVLRYLSNGTLDSSFGSGGVATPLNSGNEMQAASSLAIDHSGRIVVAGKTRYGWGDLLNADDYPYWMLARLNSDGSLDTTFNGTGEVITHFGWCYDGRAKAVTIDSSGRILAAGWITAGCVPGFGMARYNANGSLDTTFNPNGNNPGTASTDFSCPGTSTAEGASAMAFQSYYLQSGPYTYTVTRIVLAGFTTGNPCT